jgi:hypothetical protein
VPLYLDGIYYYEEAAAGPAGVAYSGNVGLKIGAEENLVLKKKWVLTDGDSLSEGVEVRVVTTTGRPLKNVNVYGNWRTNTCGGGERMSQTDAKGVAQITLDPTFTGLELMIGGPYSADEPNLKDKTRDLTSGELHELFLKHKVTIQW